MIIELHLLQSFPVSNLNRDDVGQPKTATFGGSPRARISSQSLKRAARLLFTRNGLDGDDVGVRTKRLPDEAAKLLAERGFDADTGRAAAFAALQKMGLGIDKRGLTEYLLFVSRESIKLLADHCEANWDALTAAGKGKTAKAKADKAGQTELARILDARRAADVALFGRMIADNTDLNVDAASQVAHAISTHAVTTEFDYYTAVDDLKPTDKPGADMIGTIDFNTACYYRYANVDLAQLTKNLDGDEDLVERTAKAWLGAFIDAVPGGKQNSTAARTMPDTLLAVVREHGAWNLANAFLSPVTGSEDLMGESTRSLLLHYARLRRFYGDTGIRTSVAASVSGDLPAVDGVETVDSVGDFVGAVLASARP